MSSEVANAWSMSSEVANARSMSSELANAWSMSSELANARQMSSELVNAELAHAEMAVTRADRKRFSGICGLPCLYCIKREKSRGCRTDRRVRPYV